MSVTHLLRERGVSGEFVEFFGPGVGALTVGQRAVVANMAPEYGATTGCFPIDEGTLIFLRDTVRRDEDVALVEVYAHANVCGTNPMPSPATRSC